MSRKRSVEFGKRPGNRYWWHHLEGGNFVPPIYSFLTNKEWSVLEEWYEETDKRVFLAECNVTMMSILQGFIMGNPGTTIVQLGTAYGYSSLLIGSMLRTMNTKHSFITIDIDKEANDFTLRYIKKAGLEEYVEIWKDDSANKELPKKCIEYLKEYPRIIIVDSSHIYEHTLKELELWYEYVAKRGLIFLHDTSIRAGGVGKALREWSSGKQINYININGSVDDGPMTKKDLTYLDGCGLGIIQKD